MLAGRKLLLADDSITIQKIVALTFADEGIQVVAVSNGAEAIEKLKEISPDIVVADVFMPLKTGYQVCEHIKQSEKLKHVPVMLLVGSFEPFDKVEARRVGADDILTKPFQSIRTLVDKVGALLGREKVPAEQEKASVNAPETSAFEEAINAPAEGMQAKQFAELNVRKLEADTMDLPPPEIIPPPEEPLTTAELEMTTADTQPLSPEIRRRTEQFTSEEIPEVETVLETQTMHTNLDHEVSRKPAEGFGEALLDLSHFEAADFVAADDVILDVDFDSPPEIFSAPAMNVRTTVGVETAVESPARNSAYTDGRGSWSTPIEDTSYGEIPTVEPEFIEPSYGREETVSRFASAEMAAKAPAAEEYRESVHVPAGSVSELSPRASSHSGVSAPAGPIRLEQLSPEVIDAIAKRVVEQLSEKVVEGIAWEVVPQLAELMIKRMLEEQESQNR